LLGLLQPAACVLVRLLVVGAGSVVEVDSASALVALVVELLSSWLSSCSVSCDVSLDVESVEVEAVRSCGGWCAHRSVPGIASRSHP